jgi:competence protein ComFB
MPITDTFNFDSLVNEAERLVLQELEAQLKTAVGVCTCQDCVLDMAAFALNNVKPAYRVSLMGSVYARSGRDAQHAQGISKAVREAIEKVKSNPSHD